jgi:hypothetical protein
MFYVYFERKLLCVTMKKKQAFTPIASTSSLNVGVCACGVIKFMYVKTCYESENRKRGEEIFSHTLIVDVYENILLLGGEKLNYTLISTQTNIVWM